MARNNPFPRKIGGISEKKWVLEKRDRENKGVMYATLDLQHNKVTGWVTNIADATITTKQKARTICDKLNFKSKQKLEIRFVCDL